LRWAATAAGLLTGLALAVGFESVPYLAACGAVFALRTIFDREAATDLLRYGCCLMASAVAGFFLTIGPQHWLRHSCDSIAINTLAGVVCGGAMLALAGWLKPADRVMRAAMVAGAAAFAAAALLLIEPACVRGPFGLVDPAIWPIWLGEVREMQPLFAVLQKNPLSGVAIAAFPAVAVIATAVLAKQRAMRHDIGFLAAAAVFLMAIAVTVGAIRGYSYAIWLGMPIVATMALRLFAVLGVKTLAARAFVALLLTPMALSSGAITIALANGLSDRDPFDRPDSKICIQNQSYARLAQLPPGIVATDVSYGPFLLALTPHAVLAGPYHHLSKGIVAAYRSLAAPPDEARRVLAENHADYVAICGPRPPDGLAEPARSASLWAKLRAGDVPDWLEPVDGNAGHAFAVYRMRRQP
jgi:hypothetical protein